MTDFLIKKQTHKGIQVNKTTFGHNNGPNFGPNFGKRPSWHPLLF